MGVIFRWTRDRLRLACSSLSTSAFRVVRALACLLERCARGRRHAAHVALGPTFRAASWRFETAVRAPTRPVATEVRCSISSRRCGMCQKSVCRVHRAICCPLSCAIVCQSICLTPSKSTLTLARETCAPSHLSTSSLRWRAMKLAWRTI